jgi:hypothetical protein
MPRLGFLPVLLAVGVVTSLIGNLAYGTAVMLGLFPEILISR